jgi:hypothetical protein
LHLLNPTEQNIMLPEMTSAIICIVVIETGVGEEQEQMAATTTSN